jgi:hypothetical protein
MQTISRTAFATQMRSIIGRHIGELRRFVLMPPTIEEQIPDDLLTGVERLCELSNSDPAALSPTLRQEVRQHLTSIDSFLKQMNQPLNAEFRESHLGQIWLRGHQWLRQAIQTTPPTVSEMRRLIAPASPDVLEYLGDGVYQAKWWKPVPMMDIELLRRAEEIDICTDAFEPNSLPNGLAMRFSIAGNNAAE